MTKGQEMKYKLTLTGDGHLTPEKTAYPPYKTPAKLNSKSQ